MSINEITWFFYNLWGVVDILWEKADERRQREGRESHAEPKPYYCDSAPNLLPENGQCYSLSDDHILFMLIVTLKHNLNDSDRLESFQILVFAFNDAVNRFHLWNYKENTFYIELFLWLFSLFLYWMCFSLHFKLYTISHQTALKKRSGKESPPFSWEPFYYCCNLNGAE